MLNVGLASDITWDNYILMDKKFKKLDSEKFRIHAIYGKTLEMFHNFSNKYSLTLNRHYSDNISNTIYNMLKICDIWLIFTNCIEYLTSTSLIIEQCDKYMIKYIIIGEYNRENNYYSFKYDSKLSFKKIMNNLISKKSNNINQDDEDNQDNEDNESNKGNKSLIEYFNYNNYNDNFVAKQLIPICVSPSVKEKINLTYQNISDEKKSKSIKMLYDKDELKKEKQIKKTSKEATQLQFMNNRLAYYKNLNS